MRRRKKKRFGKKEQIHYVARTPKFLQKFKMKMVNKEPKLEDKYYQQLQKQETEDVNDLKFASIEFVGMSKEEIIKFKKKLNLEEEKK